jgi:hypothetical protein
VEWVSRTGPSREPQTQVGPVEWVRMSIPLSDESHQALCQMIEVREIADLKSFALQDAEPLLDLVHKGGNGLARSGRQSGDEEPASVEPVCHDEYLNDRAQGKRVSPRQEAPSPAF